MMENEILEKKQGEGEGIGSLQHNRGGLKKGCWDKGKMWFRRTVAEEGKDGTLNGQQ